MLRGAVAILLIGCESSPPADVDAGTEASPPPCTQPQSNIECGADFTIAVRDSDCIKTSYVSGRTANCEELCGLSTTSCELVDHHTLHCVRDCPPPTACELAGGHCVAFSMCPDGTLNGPQPAGCGCYYKTCPAACCYPSSFDAGSDAPSDGDGAAE